jgi:hypothetical protein
LQELITDDATPHMRMSFTNLGSLNALEAGDRETADRLLAERERIATEARLSAWIGGIAGRKAVRMVADGHFAGG